MNDFYTMKWPDPNYEEDRGELTISDEPEVDESLWPDEWLKELVDPDPILPEELFEI